METPLPGFDTFFGLREKMKRSVFEGRFADPDQETVFDRALRGNHVVGVEAPIIRHNAGPDRPKDCFWASLTVGPIVSDRVIALLREHKVTGWTTFPVRVFSRASVELGGFHGLLPTSRCGQIDFTKGRPVSASYNPNFTHFIGGEFDPATWDGSDIFGSGSTVWIWVVERVKTLLEANGVTDIVFERLTDVEMDESNARMMNGEPWWLRYGATEAEAMEAYNREREEEVRRARAEIQRLRDLYGRD